MQVDFLKLLANKLTELHMLSASSTQRDRFPRPLFKVRTAEVVKTSETLDHTLTESLSASAWSLLLAFLMQIACRCHKASLQD